MIEKVALVRERFGDSFIDELTDALNHMQADGYDVEIQYSVVENNIYTALLIGRLTQ